MVSSILHSVKSIPYPEYVDFRIQMTSDVVYGDQPVEGFVYLVLREDIPNFVMDVVVELVATLSFTDITNHTEHVKILEKTQRGASPFGQEGLPGGKYEFPFTFQIPSHSPCSFSILSNSVSTFVYRIQVIYQVRSYILHLEGPGNRKCLRMSHKFHRFSQGMIPVALEPVTRQQDFIFSPGKFLEATLIPVKLMFEINSEPIRLKLFVKNNSLKTVTSISVTLRQRIITSLKKPSGEWEKEMEETYDIAKNTFHAGCPMRSGAVFETILECFHQLFASYGCASHSSDGLPLGSRRGIAPTTNLTTEKLNVKIHYSCIVKLHVHLGNCFTLSTPVFLSDGITNKDNLRTPSVAGLDLETSRAEAICSSSLPGYISNQSSKSNHELSPKLPAYEDVIRSPALYADAHPTNTESNLWSLPYIATSDMLDDLIENPGIPLHLPFCMEGYHSDVCELEDSDLPESVICPHSSSSSSHHSQHTLAPPPLRSLSIISSRFPSLPIRENTREENSVISSHIQTRVNSPVQLHMNQLSIS